MENLNSYVYAYLDPRYPGIFTYKNIEAVFKFRPFYVGKGKYNRKYVHLKNSPNDFFDRVHNKIKLLGMSPIIVIIKDKMNDKEAYSYERMCIESIGRRDLKSGFLTNLTDGGTGFIKMSKESSIKSSLSRKNTWNSDEIYRNNMLSQLADMNMKSRSSTSKIMKNLWNKDDFRKKHAEITSKNFSGRKNPRSGKSQWLYNKLTNLLIYADTGLISFVCKEFKLRRQTIVMSACRFFETGKLSFGRRLHMKDWTSVYGENKPTVLFKDNQQPSRLVVYYYPKGSETIEKQEFNTLELSRVHSSEWKWGDSEFYKNIQNMI